MRHFISIAIGSLFFMSAAAAFADDPPPPNGGATVSATVNAPPPPPPPAIHMGPAEHHSDDTPDHERVIKKFAIGYLGVSQIPLTGTENVPAPIVGARYWLNERMGIDAGLGFGVQGGSSSTTVGATTTTTDIASAWAFALHAGVPLSPAWGKHYTLLLIPEINFGYSGRSIKPNAAAGAAAVNNDQNGALFEIGARAGAEVSFGFMGLPELSLQATVGLGFQNQQVWQNGVGNAANASSSGHVYTFTTTVDQAPWAIFTNNISALYYFP